MKKKLLVFAIVVLLIGLTYGSESIFVELNDVKGGSSSGIAWLDFSSSRSGPEKAKIRITTYCLEPEGEEVFEGWLKDEDTGYMLSLGAFSTTRRGEGELKFEQKETNFKIYDKLVITREKKGEINPNPGRVALEGVIPGSIIGTGNLSSGNLAQRVNVFTKSELETRNEWRELWEDHVTWTRLFIISEVENLEDKEATTQRLIQNYEDMEDALKPYYGEDAGELGGLLKDHLIIAADLVEKAKIGDTEGVADAETEWVRNADDIAKLQHELNPNWDEKKLKGMWREHLRLTKREAVLRIERDYSEDAENYDRVVRGALEMADEFSSGITKQFPLKFIQ